ncbi:hypothetical protein [Methylophilus sp. QUAN]|uniref:hypothetical protein n=1 Tax=Methylophilus sp. QUAN TaxID=2781020 RepID=UPI0018908B88|nr:hypothetical protein [Methylophilus sp. QUAN]MBF4992475.1 hypothetical protein [Methylophilus sp. QUAN]
MKIQHSLTAFGRYALGCPTRDGCISRFVVTSINTLHLFIQLQRTHRSHRVFGDFLKQKSRGNHHAIGFYFVKSEQD